MRVPNTQILFIMIFLPAIIADGLTYRTKNVKRAKSVPDQFKRTPQFLEALDYLVEAHEVTTDDGYILKLYRIPGGKFGEEAPDKLKRKVILLQHPLGAASDMWVLLGKKSFPVVLAENGFEVWLANSRGTTYSYRHIKYTTRDPEYWNYSFHENGVDELPAMIDYILAYTGEQDLYYFGHSKGGSAGFTLLSMKPEYNKKIKLFVAFAPAVYLKQAESQFVQAAYRSFNSRLVKKTFDFVGFNYLPITGDLIRYFSSKLCGGIGFNPCWIGQTFNLGPKTTLNVTLLPVIYSHYPQGESVKTGLHLFQIGQTGRFAQFDYGDKENLRTYGQSLPPLYDLNKVTVPVLLYYGMADGIVSEPDVELLAKSLPNMVGIHAVNDTNFNHMDVLWGTEPDRLLFYPIAKFILNGTY